MHHKPLTPKTTTKNEHVTINGNGNMESPRAGTYMPIWTTSSALGLKPLLGL